MFLVKLVWIDFFLHGFSGTRQVYWTSGLAHGKAECSVDQLLHVPSPLDFSSVPTVLTDDLFLIRNILNPVDVLRPAASILSFDCVWAEPGKDEDWSPTARCVMDSSPQALSADVDVDDHALWFAG